MLPYHEAHQELQKHRRHANPGDLLPSGWRQAFDPLSRDLGKLVVGESMEPAEWAHLEERLLALPERKLRAVVKPFAPKMADEVARCWQWGATRPYQTGWTRRPFRHPDPRVTRDARVQQLRSTLMMTLQFPGQGLDFFTDWAAYLDGAAIGNLLASEITHGHDQWIGRLVDHAEGRVRTGGMGHHVTIGLLAADNPTGWEYVEGLLVRAQRQEGLRQAILETVDLAHPDAFRRMLDVVIDNGLTRFAATVRAAGTWFGEAMDVHQERELSGHLARLAQHLDAPQPTSGGPDTLLGLWAIAYRDAPAAVTAASEVLRSGSADERLAAVRLLTALDLADARAAAASVFGDDDPRVVAGALEAWPVDHWSTPSDDLGPGATTALLGAFRTARRGKLQIGVLAPREVAWGPSVVADALVTYGSRSIDLGEAEAKAGALGRAVKARRLAQRPADNRAVLVTLVGDVADAPREVALKALAKVGDITTDEAQVLEQFLTRRSAPVRKACLGLLSRQPAPAVAASVERLAAGTAEQQQAADALARATGAVAVADDARIPVLAEVLGLDHSRRTPSVRPAAQGDFRQFHRPIQVLVTSLYAWLDEHRDVEVTLHGWQGNEVKLLADVRWLGQNAPDGTPPLAEIIDPWWERARPLLPGGGVEAALVAALVNDARNDGDQRLPVRLDPAVRKIVGEVPARYLTPGESGLAPAVLRQVAMATVRPEHAPVLLDALATVLAGLPEKGYGARRAVLPLLGEPVPQQDWMQPSDVRRRIGFLLRHWLGTWLAEGQLADDDARRFWMMSRFIDEPLGRHDPKVDATVPSPELAESLGVPRDSPLARIPVQPDRMPPEERVLLAAHRLGLATRDDVVDILLRTPDRSGSWRWGGSMIRQLTPRRRPAWLADDAQGSALVDEVCRAALAIERQRDDLATTASEVVRTIRSFRGSDILFDYLAALGKRPFVRGYSWSGGREPALCRVIRMVEPGPDDTAETFAAAAAATGIKEQRLVELGIYAPHWASHVEATIGWPGYTDAVWWLHAHTKGDDWTVDDELRQEWEAEVARRTPLDAVDLVRGAADVGFYRDVVERLGEERFASLLKAAKLTSSSGGHKRAELFAGALSGRVGTAELVERITTKRHQDAVRALGLVPLTGRDDLLARYELLAGFVAGDRSSGSQRRASETTAVEIGMENLARTAGYRDPQRLVWSMEAAAVSDLVDGAITVEDGDVTMTLAIVDGAAETTVARAGKVLKSLPRSHAKHPDFVALRERAARLRKQASRMRISLERACVAGEAFEPDELAELYRHPLLRPMLRDLVAVADDGRCGFFGDEPGALVDARGAGWTVRSSVRIAHPHDLLASGDWPALQHTLFAQRRRQPFRQVFRELYVVTDAERTERGWSRRYAGHQVQPRQAAGLFRSRGWVADFETGFARTFHAEKLTAVATLLNGFGSPTEVEDGQLELIAFQRAGQGDVVPLDEVPPRLFSEVMRDLDLVVSIAHSGGIDLETSASTVEVRGRLVAETADLLALTNVETTDHHALVKGQLGTYSVNLGSGVVHRQPGNAICIVPVHAQQRGRVFLPFVDEDPRTAEIISKVVLLARDDKIQDPTILAQLRG